jgi:glycosyltransferase involved in cell wall biosynthesis
MNVLHVIASVNRDVGGPAITVPRLASTLSDLGAMTTLATLDYARAGPQPEVPGVRLLSLPAGALTRALRGWNPALAAALATQARQGLDIVHGHGLWMFPTLYARRAAVRARVAYVVSPRGMLDRWSLERGALRKALVWHAFERANLSSAALFHATSDAEADAIRALAFSQPIAMVPNGVDLPDLSQTPPRAVLENAHAELRGKRWLLFLSRLHPKKGLSELLDAWRALEGRFRAWHLLIAGPDLDGYGLAMRRYAGELGLHGRATFTGMLAGPARACAFGNAELFVLPSHAENFGLAVAEAMAYGLPAIVTRAAPWPALAEARCGWWIDDETPALRQALESSLALAPPQLREMGRRGRALVECRYSWRQAAGDLLAAYRWITRQGDRPACIRQ